MYDEDDVAAAMSSSISSVATSFRTSASNGLAMLFHAKWSVEGVEVAMASKPEEFLAGCGVILARAGDPPSFPGAGALWPRSFFFVVVMMCVCGSA